MHEAGTTQKAIKQHKVECKVILICKQVPPSGVRKWSGEECHFIKINFKLVNKCKPPSTPDLKQIYAKGLTEFGSLIQDF